MQTLKDKEAAAQFYLRAAERGIRTYGSVDRLAMITAEFYGALAYGEGDIMEIASRAKAIRQRLIDEAVA